MWKKLTIDDLRASMAKTEIQLMDKTQAQADILPVIQEICDNISSMWRARIKKFHSVDKRQGFVPQCLLQHILAHVRYSTFTRLPNMNSLLDEQRKEEWRRANFIFDTGIEDMYIDPVEPEQIEPGVSVGCLVEVEDFRLRMG